MNFASLLRPVTIFAGLTDEDLHVLAKAMEIRTFAAGQHVFAQGDVARTMYVVQSGNINIYLPGEASGGVSLRDIGPNEFFGELGLFDDKPRSASARATTDSVLLELQHEKLKGFFELRPHAPLALLGTITGYLRDTNAMLSMRAATDVDAEFDRNLTWSDRVADIVAELNGSWKFIILLLALTVGWCMANGDIFSTTPPDPYPYTFFNLLLGILVALQGPLIVMSQNRQAVKDRARADTDYRVNLKNEVNIEVLLRELRELRAEMKK